MTGKRRKCSRCQGSVRRDGEVFRCLLCGHEQVDHVKRGKFLDSHRDEILKDLKELGRTKTEGKWQIKQSSMTSLLQRWELLPPAKKRAPPESNNHHSLPELPAWSNDWAPEVQTAWLEAYQALLTKS